MIRLRMIGLLVAILVIGIPALADHADRQHIRAANLFMVANVLKRTVEPPFSVSTKLSISGIRSGVSPADFNSSYQKKVKVPVAFHIIYRKDGSVETGNVPRSVIVDQIGVLNAAYAGTGFSFVLDSITRTNNTQWFTNCQKSNRENQMKSTLAVDPATTLNIYSCQPAGGLLGWTYFPDAGVTPEYMDGVALNYLTLPGGEGNYNEGEFGTHIVGHYFGLYHTFKNECPGADKKKAVDMKSGPYGCPTGRDTCSGGGTDPVTNYMDYTDDSCMYQFSSGQIDRMHNMMSAYRPSMYTGGGSSCTPKSEIEVCGNGVDDDCDGDIDADDSDCCGTKRCRPRRPPDF